MKVNLPRGNYENMHALNSIKTLIIYKLSTFSSRKTTTDYPNSILKFVYCDWAVERRRGTKGAQHRIEIDPISGWPMLIIISGLWWPGRAPNYPSSNDLLGPRGGPTRSLRGDELHSHPLWNCTVDDGAVSLRHLRGPFLKQFPAAGTARHVPLFQKPRSPHLPFHQNAITNATIILLRKRSSPVEPPLRRIIKSPISFFGGQNCFVRPTWIFQSTSDRELRQEKKETVLSR